MNTRFSRNLSYCTVSLWSMLLAQRQFVNSIDVGGRLRSVLGLQMPDFLVIDPDCFKRLIKSFNVHVLFFHCSAINSFVSLIA